MRTLILLILLFAALWSVQRMLTRFKAALAERERRRELAARTPTPAEMMRACAYCDVNIPDREAIAEGEYFYCCDSHRRAGPRTR